MSVSKSIPQITNPSQSYDYLSLVELAKSGDISARLKLTSYNIKNKTGYVLAWNRPTSTSGTPVSLSNDLSNQNAIAMAVVDFTDMFALKDVADLSAAHLINLSTGETLPLFENYLQYEPGKTRNRTPSSIYGFVTRVHHQPLYDKEIVSENAGDNQVVSFFVNPREFAYAWDSYGQTANRYYLEDNQRFKRNPQDCNLYGNGGCLPRAHSFIGNGVTLVPEQGISFHDYAVLYNSSILRFNLGPCPFAEWPAAMALSGVSQMASDFPVIQTKGPLPSLMIDPEINLAELESFRFDLVFAPHVRFSRPFKVTCIFHGWLYKPLAG